MILLSNLPKIKLSQLDGKIDFYDIYLISVGMLGDEKLAREDISESLKINYVNYLGILPWITQIMKM